MYFLITYASSQWYKEVMNWRIKVNTKKVEMYFTLLYIYVCADPSETFHFYFLSYILHKVKLPEPKQIKSIITPIHDTRSTQRALTGFYSISAMSNKCNNFSLHKLLLSYRIWSSQESHGFEIFTLSWVACLFESSHFFLLWISF